MNVIFLKDIKMKTKLKRVDEINAKIRRVLLKDEDFENIFEDS